MEDDPFAYQDGRYFELDINGEEYKLHPANTSSFIHNRQSEGDHVFVALSLEENNSVYGITIWRHQMEKEGQLGSFEQLVEMLGEIGCASTESEVMEDGDYNRFKTFFGYPPIVDLEKVTAAQERHLKFAEYLLEQELVVADDFTNKII